MKEKPERPAAAVAAFADDGEAVGGVAHVHGELDLGQVGLRAEARADEALGHVDRKHLDGPGGAVHGDEVRVRGRGAKPQGLGTSPNQSLPEAFTFSVASEPELISAVIRFVPPSYEQDSTAAPAELEPSANDNKRGPKGLRGGSSQPRPPSFPR